VSDKWHFRAWRAAVAWLLVWFALMLVLAMIDNSFPWSLLLPTGLMATLFYVCSNTSRWHLDRFCDWVEPKLAHLQCDNELATKSFVAFEVCSAICFFLFLGVVLVAMVEDFFPWAAVAIVMFVVLCNALLEIRVRYLLKRMPS
jgi:hypothetical protein